MDQHPVPVMATRMEAGLTDLIGQTKIALERGLHPTPVMAIQTAAAFN
jgi:hypothetical protein